MKVQIKENSWVAKLAAKKMHADKVAIVFGNTIHLHNTSKMALPVLLVNIFLTG
jgi:hypothetical protein